MQLPDLILNDGDIFGAALVRPAFSSDLSTWNVTLHEEGLLTQTVRLAQPPKFEHEIATLRQHVAESTLAKLQHIVDEEGLLRYQFPPYEGFCVTDQPSTKLIIRMNCVTNTIDAYGPHAMVIFGETEVQKRAAAKYCKLWDALVELTPFTPYAD